LLAEPGHNLLTSLFQAISASSTTGFNTVDIGALKGPSLVFIIFLMFVGAGPGGTAGGIKNTTFAVIFLDIKRFFQKERDLNFFKRRISTDNIESAYITAFYSILVCFVIIFILTIFEEVSFLSLLFEVISAFGTVGLSMGITGELSSPGRVLISALMLFGRVGPTIVGFSLLKKKEQDSYRYAEGDVHVG
jgi:trk system potassium uptake protein TrkH